LITTNSYLLAQIIYWTVPAGLNIGRKNKYPF
jgi:hypothetical protein